MQHWKDLDFTVDWKQQLLKCCKNSKNNENNSKQKLF